MADSPEQIAALMIEQRGGREEPSWTWIAKHDPEFIAAYNRLTQTAFGYYGDGTEDPHSLPPRVKEMIAVGILAGMRDWERLPGHLERLMDLGCTDKEILEVLQTSAVITGGPAMRMGVEMLVQARGRRGEPS